MQCVVSVGLNIERGATTNNLTSCVVHVQQQQIWNKWIVKTRKLQLSNQVDFQVYFKTKYFCVFGWLVGLRFIILLYCKTQQIECFQYFQRDEYKLNISNLVLDYI
eukprot:TRINITY_DN2670_c1_g1_i6.p5 TRINITY_DN2670_c1_g1~~TRINITY_DN2670_c1_g1_i6.p5  ORF type:complete len:106 (-),score=4.20 TRINITY_DN2670_c1_g1_i6:94-411(-)